MGASVPSNDYSNGTMRDENSQIASVGIAQAPVPGQFVEASINGVQMPVPSHDSSGTLRDQKSPLPGQSVVSITVTTQSPAPEIDDAGMGKTLLLYKTMIKEKVA